MRRLAWTNLTLLGLVIALALIAHLRPRATPSGYPLSVHEGQIATSISIAFGRVAPLILERRDDHWKISSPFTGRADDFEVQKLLAILKVAATQRLPAVDLQRYGLDQPQMRLVINGQHFDFGAFNELTREQYVLTQHYVYPIQVKYFVALPKDIWALVDHQLLASDEAPRMFDFPDFKLIQQQGKWTLSPSAAVELSQDDFNRWVDNWRLASALSVQRTEPRKSLATLNIGLTSGRSLRFLMLERAPHLTLVRLNQPSIEYRFTSDISQQLLTPPGGARK